MAVSDAQVEKIKELLGKESEKRQKTILKSTKSFLNWLEKKSKSIWDAVRSTIENIAEWLDDLFS